MLRIHRIAYSTNVERVALAAGHKGLAVEWIDVDPADRAPVRALSGQDLVPVLEGDGEVVWDSPRILAWLDARYPEPPLFPRAPARRAEVETFCDWFNDVWKTAPNLIDDELAGAAPDIALVEVLRARMAASLDRFEALLDGRDWLMGDLGAADFTAFPFLKYGVRPVAEGDDEPFHRILAEGLPMGPGHRRLAEWVDRVDALPRG